MVDPYENKDKFDIEPNINSYYALWGKHEFDLSLQRMILLHFLADNNLDGKFMEYLDYWFPEDDDGYRVERKQLLEKIERLKNKVKRND